MSAATHPASPDGYPDTFVARVLDDAIAHDCRVYGLTGLQGIGKSTLSARIAALGAMRGLQVVVVSIDDVYLDQPQRRALGREVHPLLATRGPPGTHDVALACSVIEDLRGGRVVQLPRFDKIADRQLPRTDWPSVASTDLVLLEGWFLRVPAQAEAQLTVPLNALERDEDPRGLWRHYCNTALGRDYAPLWQAIDRMLFLHGPGFEVVPRWRWQQEQTLKAANPGQQAMTQPQVERFVQCFERVSRQALVTLPTIADWSVPVDLRRRPIG